jgi:hypothetical protein
MRSIIYLTLTFVILKLTGYLDWNWIWVLSPLLVFPAIFFLLLIIALAVGSQSND